MPSPLRQSVYNTPHDGHCNYISISVGIHFGNPAGRRRLPQDADAESPAGLARVAPDYPPASCPEPGRRRRSGGRAGTPGRRVAATAMRYMRRGLRRAAIGREGRRVNRTRAAFGVAEPAEPADAADVRLHQKHCDVGLFGGAGLPATGGKIHYPGTLTIPAACIP